MRTLATESAAAELRRGFDAMARLQIVDAAHPERGGIVRPDWGLADPAQNGTAAFVAAGVALRAMGRLSVDEESRVAAAAEYMLRAQRPSGLIDLRDCNFDSAPDTGFVVELFCAALEISGGEEWPAVAAVRKFVLRAVPGLQTGGFHTPNHRWVIAAALAWAGRLLGRDVRHTVAAYVAEGVDIDADGAFIEHSVAVYDSVCDRALLLLGEHAGFAEGTAAALKNLAFDLDLINPDGTAETGLSQRQDYGTRAVPASLVHCYLWGAAVEADAGRRSQFLAAARLLWSRAPSIVISNAFYTLWVLKRFGEPAGGEAGMLPDMVRLHAANRVVRVRRGGIAAGLFAGATRLMAVDAGTIELAAVKISQSYFGAGRFIAETIELDSDVVTLRSSGAGHRHRRPGYELPLGRRVPAERFEEMLAERPMRPMPPASGEVRVRLASDGFQLTYRTVGGMAGVPTQIALDFPVRDGLVWDAGEELRPVAAGEVVFLESGSGRMKRGNAWIEIVGGASAHRMAAMRDAEPPGAGMARVVICLMSPCEHEVWIRVGGQ